MFKRNLILLAAAAAIGGGASGATILYNNLTTNATLGVASRQGGPGVSEIETADDFVLGQAASVTSASFVGLIVAGPNGGVPSVTDITLEIYRVFPLDSVSPPSNTVPTRANSPSDNEFAGGDSGAGQLNFTTTTLVSSVTASNSIQAGGIQAVPNQTTGGNGPVTGQLVEFDVNFTTPLSLPADHYFFVPQVTLSNGAQFYWLSSARPISGAGTTPINPDLQSWTRDTNLDPNWLRVGTDIVGGGASFNNSFSLSGSIAPEPSSFALLVAGLAGLGVKLYRARRA